MTGRRRPPRYPGSSRPRGPRMPKAATPEMLSEAEVERRVNVEGGGQLQAPPPEHKFRDRRPTVPPPPARRRGGGSARDGIFLLGLVVIGLFTVGILLPKGPLTASSTQPPSQHPTNVAVPPTSPAPARTGGLITLDPGATSDATAPPVTEPPVTAPPATLKPGATATARPPATPQPTAQTTPKPSKTPGPTQPPVTATLLVRVNVSNGDGGTSTPGAWHVTVSSSGSANPSGFTGSSSGTTVTLAANASYSVSTSGGPAGYAAVPTINCSSLTGGLPVGGGSEICTITENALPPTVTVTTVVTGGGPKTAADWTVHVAATDGKPASFAGSASGVAVHFDANQPYDITSDPAGTDYALSSSAGCDGSGLALNATATCTFTYAYQPPAPSATLPMLPAAVAWLVSFLRGRRRWLTRPSR